jgi:DNA-binding NarL/FixJ family response regulator
MISYGANGYLSKGGSSEELKKAIYSVHTNGFYYSEQVSGSFIHSIQSGKVSLPHITAKEMELLKLCANDLSYAEIAKKLNTTTRAIEGYRDSLFKKLHLSSRVSLALFAVRFGIVPLDINTSDDVTFKKEEE